MSESNGETPGHGASGRKIMMVAYRLSWLVFVGLVIAGRITALPFAWWLTWVPAAAGMCLLVALGRSTARVRRAARPPAVECAPPVRGRWVALNSPADRVPSHGTHAYGQTYAIDIVGEPEPDTRPGFARLWPVVRSSGAFPGFGAPVLAVADATVVHASDGKRDHLSRTSLPALAYVLLVESWIRDLAGAGWVVGNHVVLDLGSGTYALYAHLRQGSLDVRPGDQVTAGQPIARCGNTGNSTEPHLHFQLMDHPDPDVARGLPFRWHGVGVPVGKEAFTVEEGSPDTRQPVGGLG
ncbi:murein hydrolase activator EnvC family protein [Streptomyces sp. NBC_01497]|uniref:murein hydrolase activator EnvC family protein n=1 Tax=Streptomyces sp. NBC_01497 TaxID=2903885 RepID=UPI002E36223F|nr:M23 family metallopeptidase [Streptomyces sp. NBC_01497]